MDVKRIAGGCCHQGMVSVHPAERSKGRVEEAKQVGHAAGVHQDDYGLSRHKLKTDVEVSEALRVSVATVRRWRLLNQGPRFIKVGASVRYRPEDIALWLQDRPTGGAPVSEVNQ